MPFELGHDKTEYYSLHREEFPWRTKADADAVPVFPPTSSKGVPSRLFPVDVRGPQNLTTDYRDHFIRRPIEKTPAHKPLGSSISFGRAQFAVLPKDYTTDYREFAKAAASREIPPPRTKAERVAEVAAINQAHFRFGQEHLPRQLESTIQAANAQVMHAINAAGPEGLNNPPAHVAESTLRLGRPDVHIQYSSTYRDSVGQVDLAAYRPENRVKAVDPSSWSGVGTAAEADAAMHHHHSNSSSGGSNENLEGSARPAPRASSPGAKGVARVPMRASDGTIVMATRVRSAIPFGLEAPEFRTNYMETVSTARLPACTVANLSAVFAHHCCACTCALTYSPRCVQISKSDEYRAVPLGKTPPVYVPTMRPKLVKEHPALTNQAAAAASAAGRSGGSGW